MAWSVVTELINPETELRKVNAFRVEGETVQSYFVKARMKTLEEKKKVWDNIWNQHKESTEVIVDNVAAEGKTNLEEREVT